MSISDQIREKGREIGFELVGIVCPYPAPDIDFFRWWLGQGFAGTMGYLQRGIEKRADPGKILPGVKSVICCAFRHTWGGDYHKPVGKRLKRLEVFLRTEIDAEARTKSYVDTGPVLERGYAARAGLGWIGKNACLIHPEIGSFFVLGEIFTTLEFEEGAYDQPIADRCGNCTKCLAACPTKALVAPRLLDARRCISYLTTARKGELTAEERTMIGDHTYGCDLCQEACPFNERILGRSFSLARIGCCGS